MKNKSVKFETKVFHNNKVYLKVSDVTKALSTTLKAFKSEHSELIIKLMGTDCISETDYNKLLSDDSVALASQGFLEMTKVETLRNKVDSVIGFQPLKFLLARDYLLMMADRTGCDSVEEYVCLHEIPKEKQKALQELIKTNESNSQYRSMIEYLYNKEQFDLEKIKSVGLDVQHLLAIEPTGTIRIDSYIVGVGVFHEFTNFGDDKFWNEISVAENGDLILPFVHYNTNEEGEINLSQSGIDRDFRQYNAVENMVWCINNLSDVTGIEDYEFEVFGCSTDTIQFSMTAELLVKLIKPEVSDIIYTDRLIDVETGRYITDVANVEVFAE